VAKINELKLIANEIGSNVNGEPRTFLEVAAMSILQDDIDWTRHFISGKVVTPWEGCAYRNVVGFVTVGEDGEKLVCLNIPLHGSVKYRPLCIIPEKAPAALQDGGPECILAHGVFRLQDLFKVLGMSWVDSDLAWGDDGLPTISRHLFDETPPNDTFTTMYLAKQLGLQHADIYHCVHCDGFISDLNGVFLSYRGDGGIGVSFDDPICGKCSMMLTCPSCGQVFDDAKFTNLNAAGECACCFKADEDDPLICIVCGEPITDVYWLIESAGREAFEDRMCIGCSEMAGDIDV